NGEQDSGIANFWLIVIENSNLFELTAEDRRILRHLEDVKSVWNPAVHGFTIEFHFSSNPYFTDNVLRKTYRGQCVPDEKNPFAFCGYEIVACEGCTINWTQEGLVSRSRRRSRRSHRTYSSPSTLSFVKFFTPPAISEALREDEIEIREHFEIGETLHWDVIPRAALYFTGEAFCFDVLEFSSPSSSSALSNIRSSVSGQRSTTEARHRRSRADSNLSVARTRSRRR
ncbi:nucleosome assembly protein 1-like 1, partial [Dinothrombium tinctorium]